MTRTETKYRVDFKRTASEKWHYDGSFQATEEEALKKAEDLLKGRSSVQSVRVVEQKETIEYRTVLEPKDSPETIYEFLSEYDGIDIDRFAWYPNCRLLNYKGLKAYFADENEMYEEDRHLYTDGDEESVYFVNADGHTWKVCKLTEDNCMKLESCLKRTRAAHLMNAFKRIAFDC